MNFRFIFRCCVRSASTTRGAHAPIAIQIAKSDVKRGGGVHLLSAVARKSYSYMPPASVRAVGSFAVGCCMTTPSAAVNDPLVAMATTKSDAVDDDVVVVVDVAVELPASLSAAGESVVAYVDQRNVYLRALATQLNDSVELADAAREQLLHLAAPFAFGVTACGGADGLRSLPCIEARFDARGTRHAFRSLRVRLVPCAPQRDGDAWCAPLAANLPSRSSVPSSRLNAALARDAATLRHAARLVALVAGREPALSIATRRAFVLWRLYRRRRISKSFDLPSGWRCLTS